MELRRVRTVAFAVFALVAAPVPAQPRPAAFADAVAMLDQARDVSDPARELELTKRAWSIIQQIATSQPASDLAIKFATRDSIGRVNLAVVYETLCLLEPTPPCLAELAWGKRDAAIQYQVTNGRQDPYDPAWGIVSALADTDQFRLARTYATRVGVANADTRRALFASATSAESRLFGPDRALQSLASIPSADDREAAAEGLPPIPTSRQRSKLQARVKALSGEAKSGQEAERLVEIIDVQLGLGFADDAKSTVDVLMATISSSEEVPKSTTLTGLRVASIARHMAGDKVGSREALTRLCGLPNSTESQSLRDFRLPAQAPWLSMRRASSSAHGRNLRSTLLIGAEGSLMGLVVAVLVISCPLMRHSPPLRTDLCPSR